VRVNIKKWGNSASVRIPHSVMAAALHMKVAAQYHLKP
jgi:antitoxin component of MazEF toxin-antitoxin module